jgi:hypothetical protein
MPTVPSISVSPCYTIRDAKELWDYAKEKYLKQPGRYGYPDFKELTTRLSDDIYKRTGVRMVPEEVAKVLATPKAVKPRSKNLLLADRNRQQMLRQARDFVAGTEKSPLNRFFTGAYQAPYSLKVFGHSTALHGTHAWPYAFDPVMWKGFGKTWVDSIKSMSESQARAIGQRIMLDPRFDEKITSGLAADPRKIYDDVQHRAGFFGKIGRMLSHSFLGLKELRGFGWDAVMDGAPEHLKTDELRKRASTYVNHMTGAPGPSAALALSGKFGKAARGIEFAPSLDVARVMRPVDLLQSSQILARHNLNKLPVIGDTLRKVWSDASPEARYIAGYNVRQWIRIAAVGSSILLLNQMLLKHFFGSDENVNVGDFDSPDWASIKAPDGSILNPTGGETSMIRTVVRMAMNPKQAPTIFGNYALGKVHPFINFVGTMMKGYGFGGTDVPAPFGNAPNDFYHWAEFVTAELGPIFTEEGIHEFSKSMADQTGVPEEFNAKVLRSLRNAVFVMIPAMLGAHYYKPSTEPKGSRGKGKRPVYSG